MIACRRGIALIHSGLARPLATRVRIFVALRTYLLGGYLLSERST